VSGDVARNAGVHGQLDEDILQSWELSVHLANAPFLLQGEIQHCVSHVMARLHAKGEAPPWMDQQLFFIGFAHAGESRQFFRQIAHTFELEV
jgi:hypothetical protein